MTDEDCVTHVLNQNTLLNTKYIKFMEMKWQTNS